MFEPKAVHTLAAAKVLYGFHKKTTRQHPHRMLYLNRKALLAAVLLCQRCCVQHLGLRFLVMGMECSHPMKAGGVVA